jgi:hypothetical protein
MASTYYPFKNAAELRDLLHAMMDTASGHDHDGTNSKAVTTGTPAADALSADADGRAIMADDYFTAAQVLAKFDADSFDATNVDLAFAANSITAANLVKLVADDAFAANATARALFAAGFMPPEKMTAAANTRIFSYAVEDLAAGVDITARPIFVVPAGVDITIIQADIIPLGSAAGIDDSNTCVISITDGTHAIASVTYDTDPGMPAAGVVGSMGALDGTYKVLSAGEKLNIVVTNGATANPPGFMLQIAYTVATAA